MPGQNIARRVALLVLLALGAAALGGAAAERVLSADRLEVRRDGEAVARLTGDDEGGALVLCDADGGSCVTLRASSGRLRLQLGDNGRAVEATVEELAAALRSAQPEQLLRETVRQLDRARLETDRRLRELEGRQPSRDPGSVPRRVDDLERELRQRDREIERLRDEQREQERRIDDVRREVRALEREIRRR